MDLFQIKNYFNFSAVPLNGKPHFGLVTPPSFGLSSACRSQILCVTSQNFFTMKILQLCFVNNLWPKNFQVASIDIKTGFNVLDLTENYGYDFDIIVAAPPCDQFTKANSANWQLYPKYFIDVARKCFEICLNSKTTWLLENPPGRIEKFIPELKFYRECTWHGNVTNKEYVVYSNAMLMKSPVKRYGKPGTINNYSKSKREAWQLDFFDFVYQNLV